MMQPAHRLLSLFGLKEGKGKPRETMMYPQERWGRQWYRRITTAYKMDRQHDHSLSPHAIPATKGQRYPIKVTPMPRPMRFFPLKASAAALAMVAFSPAASADDVTSTPLLSTGRTVMGETIHYPATGPASVVASIITLPPGSATIPHQHGAPQFAYILSGTLTVDYGAMGTRVFKEGDSFMETMATTHQGFNHGTVPVRILSVFMGADGTRNTIPMQ
jgi:quercetin dioxygenase-like cupin family protein